MKITFKEPAFFEGGYYYPGDSIEKPQGYVVPPEYLPSIIIEDDEEPKRRRKKSDVITDDESGELDL